MICRKRSHLCTIADCVKTQRRALAVSHGFSSVKNSFSEMGSCFDFFFSNAFAFFHSTCRTSFSAIGFILTYSFSQLFANFQLQVSITK